jgi:hypothetical protein
MGMKDAVHHRKSNQISLSGFPEWWVIPPKICGYGFAVN